jgi:hypothetical protein
MGNGISDNLLYDWLHKHHDIYDDLIVKFFHISLLRRLVDTIGGLACVSNCLT